MEIALQTELRGRKDLTQIYAWLDGFNGASVAVQVYANHATLVVRQDGKPRFERELSDEELTGAQNIVAEINAEILPPFLSDKAISNARPNRSVRSEFVQVNQAGGRRIYLRCNSQELPEPIAKFAASFAETK